jgi:hypothetical protein
MAASKALPSGSGRARARAVPGRAGARDQLHRSNRRGSLKVMQAPFDMLNTTWSCAASAARVMIGAGRVPGVGTGHDAERSRHAEMHQQHLARGEVNEPIFARRPRPATVSPSSRAAKSFGNGQRIATARLDLDEARPPSPDEAACTVSFRQFGHG